MQYGKVYMVSYYKDGVLEGYKLNTPKHELDWYKMEQEVRDYIGDSEIDKISIIEMTN